MKYNPLKSEKDNFINTYYDLMAVISKQTKINIKNHCDIPENRNVVQCTIYNTKIVIISINVYNELGSFYLFVVF